MSNLIPPMPTGIVPGSGYWNDWIEKLRTLINSVSSGLSWSLITGTPTTLAGYGVTSVAWAIIVGRPTTLLGYGITDAQATSAKDTANGYAGLNGVSRTTKGVTTTDDVIVASSSKGVVLQSPNGHYWRLSISNTGTMSSTDLGTTSP